LRRSVRLQNTHLEKRGARGNWNIIRNCDLRERSGNNLPTRPA